MDATDTNSTEQLLKLNSTLQKAGISLTTFIFISCVEEIDQNLSDVRDKLNISSAGMTNVRDVAENRGYVEEVIITDRRQKVYRITDKGIELLAGCRQ